MSSRTPRSRRSSCSRRSPPGGSRATGARCSSSATRCSRSTGSATRRWACSCARAPRASGACGSRPLRLSRNFRAAPRARRVHQRALRPRLPEPWTSCAPAAVSLPAEPADAPRGGPARCDFPGHAAALPGGPAAEARASLRASRSCARLDPAGTWRAGRGPRARGSRHRRPRGARPRPLGVDLVALRERWHGARSGAAHRALHDLADRAAWLALLRAPWCGARLGTLAALSGANDRRAPHRGARQPRAAGALRPGRPARTSSACTRC